MIYCVVPEELVPELYDRMLEYYADDPHVTVIVDRRRNRRRRDAGGDVEAPTAGGEHGRVRRDRRRARIAGHFPPLPGDLEE